MRIPERPPLATWPDAILTDGVVAALDRVGPLDDDGRYLHWDDMRVRRPPKGLSREAWWIATEFCRRGISRALPLADPAGAPFRFSSVDVVQARVHRIDRQLNGQGLADDLQTSDRYLLSSLMEEAITSSQLEGASTTRRVAKEMLATQRAPRTHDEQMIANNYRAMEFAQQLAGERLTPEAVLELHRIVTDQTLDDPADAGRLQRPGDERIAVVDGGDVLLHQPPPAEQLPERLEALCRFANEDVETGFVHPVVRAIILHFWLAYDHPFVDGNGRAARAVFYWSMLRSDYWLAPYLSVSSILRRAPAQYARSYLLSESDDNDVTYFVIYQLEVIERAIRNLQAYLARKLGETRDVGELVHDPSLNDRQLALLGKALREPGESFTIAAHMHLHGVVYQSARTDLLQLEELGLLTRTRMGKKFVFRAAPDLAERLRAAGARR